VQRLLESCRKDGGQSAVSQPGSVAPLALNHLVGAVSWRDQTTHDANERLSSCWDSRNNFQTLKSVTQKALPCVLTA